MTRRGFVSASERMPVVPDTENEEMIAAVKAAAEAERMYPHDGYGKTEVQLARLLGLREGYATALASRPPVPVTPERLDPEFKADLIEFAAARIQSVWDDVPGGVDAATLAGNVVAAQEFLWMSRQVPVPVTPAPTPRAPVITLCGSTKFKDEFISENTRLTMEGNVVISLGLFGHTDLPDYDWTTDATDLKRTLDRLHFQKIDMADRVHVVNPTGYFGESTAREIAYAESLGKPVTYMVAPTPEWEYGTRYLGDDVPRPSREVAEHISQVAPSAVVLRRTKEVPAGPWLPVPAPETGEQ